MALWAEIWGPLCGFPLFSSFWIFDGKNMKVIIVMHAAEIYVERDIC